MFYRQPEYYRRFQCIGGACPNSCCIGWRIDWTESEIDKVKNAPGCSQRLKELCESSFERRDEEGKFIIALKEDNRCPFLTEDNFCRIQRELGAEYLSHTCSFYPRNITITGSAIYRSCHMSCSEIIKKLLNDDKSMEPVNINAKNTQEVHASVIDNAENLAKRSELKYAAVIREFFYEIISDKKRSAETSLVLGALAAQALTKCAERGDIDSFPEIIKKLRIQARDKDQQKSIENIKPNYNIKLGILGQLLRLVCAYHHVDPMVSLTDSEGKFNIDLYNTGERLLEEYLAERPFALRNIALNLLFEFAVPFSSSKFNIFENYAVFITAYALIKLNAIAVAELKDRVSEEQKAAFKTEDFIIRSTASICRTLCQNKEIDDLIMKALSGNNMLTPAYLALLVK